MNKLQDKYNKLKNLSSPFIVAELSGNHNGKIERAKLLIDAAAQAGVDAVKLQTFTPDTITLNCDQGEFWVNDPENIWQGQSLYDLYQEAHTPWEWHKELFEYANTKDVLCFSSPFDETAVDFLEQLNCPAYKIASFELIHLPLIKKAALTGKPIIMSTGMATEEEIHDAVTEAKKWGAKQIILLKCTSAYPAKTSDANLATIIDMKTKFNCHIGLSDHTLGNDVAVVATSLGASFIEKHITLDRNDGAVDSSFSLTPTEFQLLVNVVNNTKKILGTVNYGNNQGEKKSTQYRRSIYISKNIKKGEIFTEKNLKVVRPGLGLKPKFWSGVLGKKAKHDIAAFSPLSWDIIDE